MIIIGCDFHPSFQQIAMLDTETGATEEHKLMHTSGEAERFYRKLASPAIVGIETVGNDQWFVQLLQQLGHEVCVGDAAQIRASYVRKQKTDRRDAKHILRLLVEERFPRIWIPDTEMRDHRQLLMHRHKLVQIRTRSRTNCSIHVESRDAEEAETVEHGGPGSARVASAGAMDRSTQEGFTELTGDAGCSTREPERCSDASGSRVSRCASTDESARNRCSHSTRFRADPGRCASLSTWQAGRQLSRIGSSRALLRRKAADGWDQQTRQPALAISSRGSSQHRGAL
jgi:Transposase